MSVALRLVEALDAADDCHEHVIVFAAVLLAPLYGRTVSVVDNRHGSWALHRKTHDA